MTDAARVADVTGDGDVARWSVGGAFLEGLTARDFQAVAATLHPDVRMRALLPSRLAELHGRDAVAETLESWYGPATRFEILHASVGEVAGRLQLTWRARVRPAPFGIGDGWHVIEQHVFINATETIESLDLLCSGFRPDPPTTQRHTAA
jgi:hypothetical protein